MKLFRCNVEGTMMKSQGVVVGINRLLNKWLFLRLLKNAQMQGSRNPEE